MKIMLTIALSLLALTTLTACQKAKESDPLAGYADNVRNGQPPVLEKQDERKPIPRNAFIIESEPRFPQFVEGQPGTVKLTGRLVDYTGYGKISIPNLPEGAEFDDRSNILTWTPPVGTILTYQSYITKEIEAQLHVTTREGDVFTKSQIFKLFVVPPALMKPKILDVTGFGSGATPIKMGDKKEFEVLVEDTNSVDGKQYMAPRVTFLEPDAKGYNDKYNGATMVRQKGLPERDANMPNVWKYTFVIDTSKINYPMLKKPTFYLAIMAITRRSEMLETDDQEYQKRACNYAGAPSGIYEVNYDVQAKGNALQTSWKEKHVPVFKVGQMSDYYFDVYAQANFWRLSYSFKNCPRRAKCVCDGSSRDNTLNCRVSWKPTAAIAKHKIKINVRDTSWNGLGSANYERNIKVLPQPTPPSPNPSSVQERGE